MKKTGKYSVLLGIKESYLLSRNLYGLLNHPFKTIRAIFREKDYSQLLLLFGLPFYTFIAGIVFIISARFLINAPAQWGVLANSLLFFICSFSFVVFIYLSYWLIKIKSKTK
ncbi:MAG TPA: hypothetical protein VMW29_04235 [Candidatus Bathyarchaeia archaeon]|nr:hypothetical protein [Candidatus Bathyarchaeia archaeon]